MLGLRQEIEEVALVELGLADDAALEQGLAGGVEGAVEDGEEDGGFLAEDLAGVVVEGAEDVDVVEDLVDVDGADVVAGFAEGGGGGVGHFGWGVLFVVIEVGGEKGVEG